MDKIMIFRCIINVNIGQANKRKFDMLNDTFKKDYPLVGSSADFSTMYFRGKTDNILINPQQIIISIENQNVTLEQIRAIQGNIDKIFNILLLDENVSASYNFIINKEYNDSMGKSQEMVSEKFKNLSDIKGFGIRAFFEYKNNLSEIRIEPFLLDNNKLYIESLINYSGLIYKQITDEAEQAYNYFNQKYEELIKKVI
jgi:hypothetical protein